MNLYLLDSGKSVKCQHVHIMVVWETDQVYASHIKHLRQCQQVLVSPSNKDYLVVCFCSIFRELGESVSESVAGSGESVCICGLLDVCESVNSRILVNLYLYI